MKLRAIMVSSVALLWCVPGALALDVGVGGIGVSVGNGGVTADVGGGDIGVGAGGVTADVGVGHSTVGADVGTGGGTTGGVAGAVAGAATGVTSSSSATGALGSTSTVSQDGTTTASVPAEGTGSRVGLPDSLMPAADPVLQQWENTANPSPGIRGVPNRMLKACRDTVAEAAQPYGVVDVSVISNGQAARNADGSFSAPVYTSVVYQRDGGYERRQAPILCAFGPDGQVSELRDVSGGGAG